MIRVDLILDRADSMYTSRSMLFRGFETMLRRALTYQLILAVAVGPLLCCCTVGKSLASPPSTPYHSSPRTPAERVSHSCCSHKHGPAKSDSDPKPAPTKPGHPTDKCPCKDGGSEPQTTQVEPTQSDVATFLRSLTLDTVAPFDVPTSFVDVVSGLGGLDRRIDIGAPTLTTAELLYAHHMLRC